MTDETIERLAFSVSKLERSTQVQARQIATLIGFIGTLLGAMESKRLLQPDDVQVLVDILQRIAPDASNRVAQNVLKDIVIAAEDTPQMMEAETGPRGSLHLGPLHVNEDA